MNILINLPKTFHSAPVLSDRWARLAELGEVRHTSHDTQEQILPDLKWADAVLMWTWPVLDDAMLSQTKIKFIGAINTARPTARTCLARGIAISETRHCWSPAVAEMALGLILTGLRRISDYHAAMRVGTENWNLTSATVDPRERMLTGRTVGVVGFGAIARRLAELLKPFNVTLLAHDPYVPQSVSDSFGAKLTTVRSIAEAAEVIVLCAAEAKSTRHIFGADAINAMKPGTILVNIGRASLVDTNALITRLGKGDIVALLDVFDQEPLAPDSPLRTLPNAYLTPHRAGGLVQTTQNAIDWLTADLRYFLENKPRKFAVTEEMLPSLPD